MGFVERVKDASNRTVDCVSSAETSLSTEGQENASNGANSVNVTMHMVSVCTHVSPLYVSGALVFCLLTRLYI